MSIQDALSTGNTCPVEPIPGYRLLERIGRGGYGEVWKTMAPGGVPKAVKLIYADDSSRMATELRSLNRIKDVRHPFLLSIERIEQCGGLLAIVTELGDKNLQQHFQECVSKGLTGIPQEDLLEMMRDVADVLDYIYAEFALQHLDIKPANLLLFGRRLKVADFGLVKNIYERSSSQVQGLTPTYAAPEIFEGQPTRACDQYSLAILYQEMLTGILPFNGMTAARLATQHLQEAPDLSPLPAPQRPVIARALSKDPARRYSNCMELVKELTTAAHQSSAPAAGRDRSFAVEIPTAQPSATQTAARSASRGQTHHPSVESLQNHDAVPTIVLGIGGAAGKAMQRLRLRIGDRLAAVDAIPAFKMLIMDVDDDALNEVNQDHQAWSDLETVPTPLHNSTVYREQGHQHRRWLSRRWLFNIPRNHRTDGLRPLGRLALLSNTKRVMMSLRSAIQTVAAECPGTAPRILIVASISGGTGSGMVLDLAYAARNELRNAGFPEASVDGVLLHSTPVGPGRDKAVLNAIATLCELQQYSAVGSYYPGEPLLQIPPFHGNNQTFTSTQFLHLGEDLDEANWLRAIDNVAELLYCRLLTNLDKVLDTSRSQVPSDLPSLDLVRVQQIGGYAGTFVDDLTRQLCVDLINSWRGTDSPSELGESRRSASSATLLLSGVDDRLNPNYQKLTAEAESQILACGVDVKELHGRARQMLEQELQISPREFLQAQFNEIAKMVSEEDSDHEVARITIAQQDCAIGLDFGERPVDSPDNKLFDMLHSRTISQAMPIASRFITWVCDLIDQPTGGIDAARHAAEAGRDCIREIISYLGKEISERQTRQTASRIQLLSPPPPGTAQNTRRGWLVRRPNLRTALAEKMIEHGLSSFEELLDVVVHLQLRAIEANILSVIDHLLNMWHELKQLGRRIASENAANSNRGIATPYERSLQKWLLEYRPRLVQVLRTRIEQDILSGPKKLQRFLQQQCSYDEILGDPLRRHARQVVLHSIDYVLSSALQQNVKGLENHNLEICETLGSILHEPWVLEGGGSERATLVVPKETGTSVFQNQASAELRQVPILPAKTNSVAVCRLRQDATIQGVIQSITHGHAGLLTVAANLHTRIDVEWKPLAGLSRASTESDLTPPPWTEVPQTVQLQDMALIPR